ncbi:MAG TPA: sulfurtransferase TusA family protein [Caulobacteraceae bacterium]
MVTEDEIVVEARGHLCPTPTLRLRRAAERAPAGTVLKLVADDPMAKIDAPHFAGEAGLEVLSISDEAGVVTVRVRKPV